MILVRKKDANGAAQDILCFVQMWTSNEQNMEEETSSVNPYD